MCVFQIQIAWIGILALTSLAVWLLINYLTSVASSIKLRNNCIIVNWLSYKYYNMWYLGTMLCIWAQLLSRVWLFATLWTIAYQAALSLEFSWQEDGDGLPFPAPGLAGGMVFPTWDWTCSLASPTLADRFFTTAPPRNILNAQLPGATTTIIIIHRAKKYKKIKRYEKSVCLWGKGLGWVWHYYI